LGTSPGKIPRGKKELHGRTTGGDGDKKKELLMTIKASRNWSKSTVFGMHQN